jgi:DNA-binding transcriptional LysR family regulator
MDIDQLETFLAVANYEGFHRAAESLRISQPAVSARIRSLEESLGVALFERSRNGLTITGAGRILRPHAERLLQQATLARQAVHDLQPERGGPLVIAASLSTSEYVLPDALKRFQKRYPNVNVTIRSGHSKHVLELVLSGEAEIGLARSLVHPQIETVTLREDPLLLTGHRSDPRTRKRTRLQDVAEWPLILFEQGSGDWALTQSLFRGSGLVPNIAYEVDSIETAKQMVGRGMGFAFLPQIAVHPDLKAGRLRAVEIVNAEPLRRSLDVVHPRHRALRREAADLVQLLRQRG